MQKPGLAHFAPYNQGTLATNISVS